MKVIFAIPTIDGTIKAPCMLSLLVTQRLLQAAGIDYDVHILSDCPYLSVARNTMAAWFLADPDATDHFFIDYDIGFDETKVLEILKRPEGIVGGVYPLKQDQLQFPVQIRTQDGVPLGRDGLIEGELQPTGFMRIKRGVYEHMAQAHPELKYVENVVGILAMDGEREREFQEAYDFFGFGPYGRKFRTEDYAFCQRWRDLGGTVWVYPNINFVHIGRKAYKGNYHEFLMRLPGGAKDFTRLAHFMEIPGLMQLEELQWLVEQARAHERIVEIGSYLGRSTRALAENTPGNVWAVDDWKGPREIQWKNSEDLEAKFRVNLRDLIESGKVFPIHADHGQPNGLLSDVRPDMVFIDGDHAYESVIRDIEIWKARILPGGLLCGHDFDWPAVRKAVDELLPARQTVPETSLWFSPVEGAKT